MLAEHHEPARVGVRYLLPEVPAPRPFIVGNFIRAGDSQERRDKTGFQVRV